jgi:DNA-binding NtrC family response regulator
MVFDSMARHKGGVMSIAPFRAAIDRGSSLTDNHGMPAAEMTTWLNLSGRFPTLKELEEVLIAEALKLASGNQGAAAALLGISRQALNRKLCGR